MKMLPTVLLCLSFGSAAMEDSDIVARYQQIRYRSGDIILGNQLAKLALGDRYAFVGSDDADFILEKLWGNPRQEKILGMIFPAAHQPMDTGGWCVVVQYDEDGHVRDNDAASVDYGRLLRKMQQTVRRENGEREKKGYLPMELLGWAEKPHYDARDQKLYWAKALRFGQNADTTLNYNIRILGRKGVLLLNVVASMRQLDRVRSDMGDLLSRVDFLPGNRYDDYKKSIDPVAPYGLAALVVGGVLVKPGFFKTAWAALLALKKFFLLAVVILAFLIRTGFRRRSQRSRASDSALKKSE